MDEHGYEPGLLRIFRLYVAVRLAIIAMGAYLVVGVLDYPASYFGPFAGAFIADVAFLVGMLCWGWPRRRLERRFLPLALAGASVVHLTEVRFFLNLFGVVGAASKFWLNVPFLLVPLILMAWQYEFRHVLLYSLGMLLLEIALTPADAMRSSLDLLTSIGVLAGRSALFVLIGRIVSHLMDEQRLQRRDLAHANARLVLYAATLEELAVTRERNRLARELHDTMAHTLSSLAVQLDAIEAVWTPLPERAEEMLERALQTTRAGLDETRRALQALRASPLEAMGLANAVRNLAESAAGRAGASLELDIPEAIMGLSADAEQACYRIAQEALENVVKHASASKVSVSLRQAGADVVLVVEDDGRGMVAPDYGEERFGLRGMRERASLIGANLNVGQRPQGGTAVRLELGVGE